MNKGQRQSNHLLLRNRNRTLRIKREENEIQENFSEGIDDIGEPLDTDDEEKEFKNNCDVLVGVIHWKAVSK